MAEDNTPKKPDIPRPIGIKPITIKPMQPLQKSPPADAPKNGDSTDQPQPPVADTQKTDEKPAAPDKPIAIAPKAAAGKPLSQGAGAPTIRLKTIRKAPETNDEPRLGSPAPKPSRPQTIQSPSIKPSIRPPLDSASKSKTSRISLDSAFGDTMGSPNIHIGPSSDAPVGKITSSFNVDSLTAAKGQTAKINLPLASTDGDVTRRRTLRVKAATASPTAGKPDDNADAITDAPTVRKKKAIFLKKDADGADDQPADDDDGEEAHISAFSAFQQARAVEKINPVFPLLAVAAAFMIITLTVLYMSQACGPDRSLTAFSSFPSISVPSWPGQVNTF